VVVVWGKSRVVLVAKSVHIPGLLLIKDFEDLCMGIHFVGVDVVVVKPANGLPSRPKGQAAVHRPFSMRGSKKNFQRVGGEGHCQSGALGEEVVDCALLLSTSRTC
jgi:hypothetical protein